jgi:dihydrofolate reductase
MILSGIAALAANRVIGKGGDLPWRLPEDMKFFKDKTLGHSMIMGRKTFESLPGGKPLPDRLHIVISRRLDYRPIGAVVVPTLDDAIHEATLRRDDWGEEIFVIGGGEIFALALPRLDRMYLTEIHREFAGDAYFPQWNPAEFSVVERRERHEPLRYDFVTYERARA